MSRQLPHSIIASAVFSVVLAGTLVTVGSWLARPTIRNATLRTVMRTADLDACEAAPSTFGRGAQGLSLFAYDRRGRSAHPDAPPLEAGLLREVLDSGETATRERDGQIVSVLPRGGDGHCALVRISYGRLASVARAQLLAVLVLATLGGMVLSALGTYGFVVRPLRRRIVALASSARALGTPAFTAQPRGPDDLGTIAEVLTETHARVQCHRDTLERRNMALEDHLATVAHDLRTPLASLHLALESLASDSGPGPAASRALSDVVYLSALVDNLHQAARLRHDIDIREGAVELGALIRRLEERFSVVGLHGGIAVAASVPESELWAACAPAFAERAVANVIQNAVEHNRAPGHVAITLERSADGASFSILVLDDGPGLPEHARAHLSEPTFLADAARSRGPGLGMLITHEVAQRAGWTVSHEPWDNGHGVRLSGPTLVDPAQA